MDATAADHVSTPDLSSLRVALVHDWLTGLRGGEKCLEVLCGLFPRARIHTLIHKPGSVGPVIEAMDIRTSPLQRLPGIHRHYRHFLPMMPWAASRWRVGDVDLVVSLSHCVAKAVRVPPGVPHACYCFTPMRYAWDGRRAYLEGMPLLKRLALGVALDRLRAWDRATAGRVTHFIAISETIRDRIARCYGRESTVIPPPVDTRTYTPDGRPREDFYLCVSALVPYKKVDQAVQACSGLGLPLVVIGTGPERARLERLAGPSVRFLGWQPDEVIRDHLNRCRALLFPGEEDFGIVPVEALACGAPVIALGRGGAAETVCNRVGRLYNEPTSTGLARAIMAWEALGRPHDPAMARRRAEGFGTAIYRERMARYLAGLVAPRSGQGLPAPHIPLDAPSEARKLFESPRPPR